MTAILGVSAFYHDSAAALLVDGRVVAAAQEERFTRRKNDETFPEHSIAYCLETAGLSASQIDHVGFYEKPLLKFDRLVETYLNYAPKGFHSFRKAMPEWAGPKLQLRREIRKGLGGQYQGRICFCEHHQSHAASAFFPSPFEEAAILTLDGVGEWATTSMGIGRSNQIELNHEIHFPHSLGLLYSAFTYFSGFRVNSDEYKLMGLAPYGQPKYVDLILEKLITVNQDGSYRLNLDYFDYCHGLRMTSQRFHRLFGCEPRRNNQPIREIDMDLAASVQRVVEKVVQLAASHLHATSGCENLCLAGGVALNCVSNGKVLRKGPFKNIWVQPASGDAGGALGVAYFIWHQLMGNQRQTVQPDAQFGSLLGPKIDEIDLTEKLSRIGAKFDHHEKDDELAGFISKSLADGKLIGLARGRMEFGPRALGNRSILADPRCRETQRELNLKTKFRESFRPFAPIVLSDRAAEFFQWSESHESPYMLMVTEVQESIRCEPDLTLPKGLDRVNDVRSELPAITHVDYSARLQTVDEERNPFLHQLLKRFDQETGCPVLVNTSFNVRDEPIVCTWMDALACFLQNNLDILVLQNFVLSKEQQNGIDQRELERLRDMLFLEKRVKKQRHSTQFVMSLCMALSMMAGLAYWRFQVIFIAVALLLAVVTIMLIAFAVPASRATIEDVFKKLTLPIRSVVTIVLLALVYYGIMTPIGLLLRRRFGESWKHPTDDSSQWKLSSQRDLESYFKTY